MKTRKTKKRNIIRRTVAFLLCMTMVLGLGMQDVIEQVYAEEAIPVIEQEAATEAAGELTTEGAAPEENAETAEEPDESVGEAEEQPANSTPSQPADAEENTKTDVPSAPAENAGSEEGEKQNPSAPAEDGQSGSDSETSAETNPGGNTGNEITAPAEDGTVVTKPDETVGEETEDEKPAADTDETTEETTEPAEEEQEPVEEEAQAYDEEETVGNVTIHVYAEAGVLPEDAQLSVTPIEKKEITEDMSEDEKAKAEEINAQYEETEQKLTEQLQEEAAEETETLAAENVSAGVNAVSESADADAEAPVVEKTLKGFLSYDISFLGENGEEIEPEGEVQVSFEFAEAALPDETSENMEVAVKHFKEEKNADGGEEIVVEDLTEAETTNIETEGESGAAVTKVELVANSFSEYTIVWYESIRDRYYKDSVEICYINTDGDEIVASLSDEDLKQYGENSPIDLENSEYNVDIEGYHYLKAVLARNPNSALQSQTVIRSLRLYNKGNFRDNWSIQYQGEYGNWSDIEYGQKIYIIYEPDPDTPGGGAVGDLAHRKYVEDNGDGTYDLTLDVTGAMGTETNPASVDVVLVLDLSSSMDKNNNLTNAKQAIYKLISDLESVSTVESRWKLVTFGNDATPANGWKSSTEIRQDVRDAEVPWSFNGVGTNYQAGLEAAGDAIRSSSADNRIVVFLTDGQPTFHGDGVQGGGDKTTWADYNGAIKGAGTITCDRFYAVGMNLTEDWVGKDVHKTGEEVLQDVANAVQTQQRYVTNVKNIESDLENVFAGIAGEIIRYDAKNVTIIDKLTDEVDPIENAQPVIKVTNADGQDVTSQEVRDGKITASYTPGTKELTLQVGEPTYALKQDYTYSVTLRIQPNESAKELYVDSGYRYPHKGEADTGLTSEGKGGIFTNVENSAKVTWTTDEQQKEGTYNRPVVQIPDEELPVRPPETEQELSKEKYVKDNQDGTYDLTLNVSGKVGSLTNNAKIDIVFVLDLSGSMADNGNLDKAKNAVNTLTNQLAGDATVDSKWKLVTFSDGGRIVTENWESAEQINTRINNYTNSNCDGGTNYQAALTRAGEAIKTARSEASKVVIFLTDGQPTYHDENTYGGGTYTNDEDYNGALVGAATITCDQFYAIGMDLPDDVGLYTTGIFGEHHHIDGPELSGLELLQNVANKVNASVRKAQNVDKNGDLSGVFEDIAGSVLSFLCSDVTITDTLSDWAEVADEDAELKITVTKSERGQETLYAQSQGGTVQNGATLSLPETETNSAAELSATYDPVSRQIKLDFPNDYKLEGDLTYYVTVKIAPTVKAYEDYQNNPEYPHTGDDGTDAPGNDTSSNKLGFWSNKEATVTYTYNDQEQTENYPNPVIQVDEMTTEDTPFITVSKTFTGLSEEQVDKLKEKDSDGDETNDFVITVSDGTKSKELRLSEGTSSEDGLTYTWRLEGYEPGTYSVKEDNAEIDNYELKVDGVGDTVVVDLTGWTFSPSVDAANIAQNPNVSFAASDKSVVMIALKNPGNYLVWTKEPLSASQQNAVKTTINGFADAVDPETRAFYTGEASKIYFHSGLEKLETGISYGGSKVIYKNEKLTFSPSRQWEHVLTGSYEMTGEVAGDINITNSYTLNQIFIDFQKYGTDYNTEQLTATFKLEKMVTTPDGSSLTGAVDGESTEKEVSAEENEFGGLTAGVYRLTEIKAPDGYSLLDKEIYFRVSADGVELLKIDNNKIIPIENTTDMYELEVSGTPGMSDTKYTIKIKNNTLYDLPQAGGTGIYLYMLGGVALMMAGTLLVYKKRKEEVLRS